MMEPILLEKFYAEDQAERRREYKEAIGEEESIKQLEEAAKQLGQGQKKLEGSK
jgi:hypothetical protein